MMLADVDGKKEIRSAVICANPGAIQPQAYRGSAENAFARLIFNHVNQSLACLWLPYRMSVLVRLNVEMEVIRAARCQRPSHCCLVLGDHRQAKSKNCKQYPHCRFAKRKLAEAT